MHMMQAEAQIEHRSYSRCLKTKIREDLNIKGCKSKDGKPFLAKMYEVVL
jgi:hypothetical protein